MKFYGVKLLTVTCEILVQKNVLDILAKHRVSGYTTYEVSGSGTRGLRGHGLKDEKNVKIEALMHEEKLQAVIEEISQTLFTNFALILYVSDAGVIRAEKFA